MSIGRAMTAAGLVTGMTIPFATGPIHGWPASSVAGPVLGR
jgi:hypothetical protein